MNNSYVPLKNARKRLFDVSKPSSEMDSLYQMSKQGPPIYDRSPMTTSNRSHTASSHLRDASNDERLRLSLLRAGQTKKVAFKLDDSSTEAIQESSRFGNSNERLTGKMSQSPIISNLTLRTYNSETKRLLVQKNAKLLKAVIKEWHLFALKQFKRKIESKYVWKSGKKKRPSTATSKKKKAKTKPIHPALPLPDQKTRNTSKKLPP